MPKSSHTEEQFVAVMRQVQAGARVDNICRKVGISQATYCLWKRQYSGVGVSELRQLREENGRLKGPAGWCIWQPIRNLGANTRKDEDGVICEDES